MNELATLSIAGATAQETAPDSVPAGQRTLSVADDANIRSVSDPRVYPGQFYGIGKPSYRKDLYERYLAWYGKYVKGDPAAR
jgi:hypothetical protein